MRLDSLNHGLACLALLQCLASSALAQTPASDGPANFQGLYLNPTGTVETLSCDPSSIFALSSTFAGCCSIGGNCNFPTACARGQPTNRKGGKWTCGPDRACYTMTVYGAYPDPSATASASATESWVVHNCAKSWSASTIYRRVPASLMTTGTATASSSSSATADVDAGTVTDSPDASGPAAASTADRDNPVPGEAESQPSRAWIAGVVVGCVVACAVLGGLGFWFGRRRKRNAGRDGEHGQKGFAFHSSAPARSGGGWFASQPRDDEAKAATVRANAVAVAEGVEVEGHVPGYGLPRSPQELASPLHAELESVSTEKKGYYNTYNV